ncbi:PEP-CTERM sorting domain-containing protein [Microcystis aeruginosa]|uniref:Genome sequencing data, contig C247 n=1 Tax=Microcystis aeruginosa PCC 9701 TaxID=721123 RepID=I4IUT6_MICAE|nr:PEP-CTERM sorting domain-containing protein [Microcystis aeruginosa]CCI38060.1 Genome sequencing data, contig C247 [Microcystis aeruginosa PCC 9701]
MTQKVLAKLMSFAGCDKLGLFKIAIASSCLMIVPQGQVRAASVTILNPSFEDPIAPQQPDGYFYSINDITNWVIGGLSDPGYTAGVDKPVNLPNTSNVFFTDPIPDGSQVGSSNGRTISQTLSATLQANTQYTLGAYVGRRLILTNVPSGYYNIELLAGSTVLASNNSITPLAGEFELVTVNYASGVSDPLIGQALTIRLTSTSQPHQVNFDNITLDASPIPEPSAILGLLGFGLLGIGSTLKQKR